MDDLIIAERSSIVAISDAIREKTGSSELLSLNDIPALIASLTTGGGTGSGGTGGAEVIYAEGSYIPTSTGENVVEHGIGVVPDIITMQGPNALKTLSHDTLCSCIAFNESFIQSNGNCQIFTFILNGALQTVGYSKSITDTDPYGWGFITEADANQFKVGGDWIKHLLTNLTNGNPQNYTWRAYAFE